ncbi:MAG: hypothetical protein PWP31_1119 [Clostridia bacterium]|nr:hypothetical protein [Clostridia bacterium]
MLPKKMTVGLVLGLLLFNTIYIPTVQAAVIDDLHDIATVLAPQKYNELSARVNTYTRIYRVEKGDTLDQISRRYQTDPELVAVMNYLDPNQALKPGQFLVLPYEKEPTYRVAYGDTLWSISRRYNVNVDELAAVNGITEPRKLKTGIMLNIPASTGIPVSTQNSKPGSSVSRGEKINSFLYPIIGAITSRFGWRDRGFHHGLDIAADIGDKIRAVFSGKVVFSGWANNIYGNMVKIDHGNGIETVYAHNSRNLVKKGQYVRAGDYIAEVGDTGNATGSHVHFEVRKNGKALNPERFLVR